MVNGVGQRDTYRAAINPINKRYVAARVSEDAHLKSNKTYDKILARDKHLQRNNWIVAAIRRCMVSYVVGRGITPAGGDSRAMAIWQGWSRRADVSGTKNFTSVLREVVGGLCMGDVLVVLQSKKGERDDRIAARVHVIDGARVRTPSDMDKDDRVQFGVEYDSDGAEVAYWVSPASGEDADIKANYTRVERFNPNTGRFISLLLRNPDSDIPGRSRGLPMSSTVMSLIEDTAAYEDSGVRSGIVKNLLAVMLETEQPSDMRSAFGATNADGSSWIEGTPEGLTTVVGQVEDGSVVTVPVGTTVKQISHGGNVDMVALMKETLRHICGAVEIPYEILVSDFSGINFSAGKLDYDKFFRKVYAWTDAVAGLCSDLYAAVVTEGYLVTGDFPTTEAYRVSWVGSGLPDVNPAQSAIAENRRLRDGTVTRSGILAEQGKDYEQYLKQRMRDEELEQEILGYKLTAAPAEMEANAQGYSEPKDAE